MPYSASGRKRAPATPAVKVYWMLSSMKIGASSSMMVSVTLSGPVTPRGLRAVADIVTLFLACVNTSSFSARYTTATVLAVWPAGMVKILLSASLYACKETASFGVADTVSLVAETDLLSSVAATKIRPRSR